MCEKGENEFGDKARDDCSEQYLQKRQHWTDSSEESSTRCVIQGMFFSGDYSQIPA